jgi:glucose-6-phosphate 1-dehydrogenase
MELLEHPTAVRGGFCIEEVPQEAGFVIFGASGDLTARKLLPALFSLYRRRLLPSGFFVVGCARTALNDASFRARMREALGARQAEASQAELSAFLERCFYQEGGYQDPRFYAGLAARLAELDRRFLRQRNHVFYLATPPGLYRAIVEQLGSSGLARQGKECCSEAARFVVEKPFGRDLDSAMDLDGALARVFTENQIYRIDHYLGKETVQNILLFRFANSIFEPIWNRRYIDSIQISVAETLGVEHRAGYFEQAGLLRDMFQNHLLQMLSLVAMEPPCSFDADRLRDEKVKLLRSIRPFQAVADPPVRGQYSAGSVQGRPVPGYREEPGVDPGSRVETFVAAKLFVDNWRWEEVPFYLRAGKRLERKTSTITVRFKSVPHSMFVPLTPEDLSPNTLTFQVQPEEGISLQFQAKHPGPKLCMDQLSMRFQYSEVLEDGLPEAYERLLLDCLLGDQTLFIRHDDLQVSWALITPLLEAWEAAGDSPEAGSLYPYPAGSSGPQAADELLARDGRAWAQPPALPKKTDRP